MRAPRSPPACVRRGHRGRCARRRGRRRPCARVRYGRAARGHPGRGQGPLRRPRPPARQRQRRVRRRSARDRRRDGGRAPARRGRPAARHDAHARARVRADGRQPRARHAAESVGGGSCPGRLEQRVQCGRGRSPRAGGTWHGHGRLGAHPGELLRHHRAQADVRPGEPRGRDAARVDARPRRTIRTLGGGRSARARNDRRP